MKIIRPRPVIEGAGVRLNRVFGADEVPMFDPFLLLDHFGSDNPDDYMKGFPWHPHRGIETVTYMLAGEVEHGDSLGNSDVIKSGHVQWMRAGQGIIHQEMPRRYRGRMQGLQLWINLARKDKMSAPMYNAITELPRKKDQGAEIKVIMDKDDIRYYDITTKKPYNYEKKGHKIFAYILEGRGEFNKKEVEKDHCILFEDEKVTIRPIGKLRFILVSGRPLNEPVAWGGPIVMNTQEELNKAFQEIDDGSFIR